MPKHAKDWVHVNNVSFLFLNMRWVGGAPLHDGLVMTMTGDFTSKMTGENF